MPVILGKPLFQGLFLILFLHGTLLDETKRRVYDYCLIWRRPYLGHTVALCPPHGGRREKDCS